MKKKIAIFGGSFNPPHIGHYKVIELVRDTFPCDEIWLMPSGDRKDKQMHADSVHRLAFANIMANELQKDKSPKILVSTIELDRKTLTTTIDSLFSLEEKYPDHEFHLIISSELIPEIKISWHRGKELFERANYILVERPGSHKFNDIELPYNSHILESLGPTVETSSTLLRNMTTEEELRRWTSKDIVDYIKEHRLYGLSDKM